jgi:hypothetical protein
MSRNFSKIKFFLFALQQRVFLSHNLVSLNLWTRLDWSSRCDSFWASGHVLSFQRHNELQYCLLRKRLYSVLTPWAKRKCFCFMVYDEWIDFALIWDRRSFCLTSGEERKKRTFFVFEKIWSNRWNFSLKRILKFK